MFGERAIIIVSHWNTMIENLQVSPKEFLASVEKAIESKQIPNIKRASVDCREGGILSSKREYLRIKRKDHAFDICGAPFGNGFFVSWWLGEIPSFFWSIILSIPFLGSFAERFIKPSTYYKTDTAIMFQSLVHSAVLEVVDNVTQAKGLKALSELERKPVMRDFFKM